MKPHLPVFLFRSLLTCLATGITFATSFSYASEPEEEEQLMLLSAEYPNGRITYTEKQMSALTFTGYESICFKEISSSGSGGAILNFGIFTLCGNGEVSFRGNKTTSYEGGGAIYNNGSFSLNGNGAIAFNENSSSTYGGAIYNKSIFSLKDNEDVIFIGNTSSSSIAYGGAICNGVFNDANGTFELRCNGNISFCGNIADYGGAISNSGTSTFMLDDNGDICFSGNTSASNRDSYGGAIYNDEYAAFSLNNNGDVTFSGNKATYGSAILNKGSFTLSDNGNVSFCENLVSSQGAISNSGAFTLSGNGDVRFSGNVASSYYGAAAIFNGGTFSLRENGNIAFTGNTASSGSAILNSGAATFMLENNGDICFSKNTATITANVYLGGGAIYNSSNFTLSANREVSFIENISSSSSLSTLGGAICNDSSYATFTLSENGNVTFIGNTSSFSSTSSSYAVSSSGGAIYNSGSFDLNGNGAVSFINNTASSAASFFPSFGGAIRNSGTFALRDNGEVSFIENTASYGGAIYNSDSFMLCGNGNVTFKENTSSSTHTGGAISNSNNASFSLCGNVNITFSGNTASSDYHNPSGGAILNEYDATFTLSGNGDVLFEKNAEIDRNGTYCLRSVYSRGTLNLAASEGKSILFKDSLCASGIVNLNHEGLGDIIFTGISSELDLREVKGGIDGTAQEILNSRTSEISTNAMLYGGRLIVEDGAILKVNSLSVAEGARVLIKDGSLALNNGNATITTATGAEKAVMVGTSLGESSLAGADAEHRGMVEGANIDIAEGTNFSLGHLVLGATTRITDVPATALLHDVTAELTADVNTTLMGETVLSSGVTLVQNDNAAVTLTLSADAKVALVEATTFDTVTLSGESLVLNFSGFDVVLFGPSEFIGLSFTGGGDYATFDSGLSITMTLDGEHYAKAYRVQDGSDTVVYFNSREAGATPEPATTTLSLLALTVLAARRKRK